MSAFIASSTPSGGLINTDAFWPGIDLDALRATLRIDASVTPARLETAVVAAAINLNRELAGWRSAKQAEGFATLSDVPAARINGESVQVKLYLQALQAATAAHVCERYRGYDSTAAGNTDSDRLAPTIDDYRRDQRWAVRDFLGQARSTVELI